MPTAWSRPDNCTLATAGSRTDTLAPIGDWAPDDRRTLVVLLSLWHMEYERRCLTMHTPNCAGDQGGHTIHHRYG